MTRRHLDVYIKRNNQYADLLINELPYGLKEDRRRKNIDYRYSSTNASERLILYMRMLQLRLKLEDGTCIGEGYKIIVW